jgi:hypothetical protein
MSSDKARVWTVWWVVPDSDNKAVNLRSGSCARVAPRIVVLEETCYVQGRTLRAWLYAFSAFQRSAYYTY